MTSPHVMRTVLRIVAAACLCLAVARVAAADQTLFRLHLTDGTTLLTFGEYARVGDRVIFSMLMGGTAAEPRLQAATLPAQIIDWERTERHANSTRYQQYALTRGEEDFARLSNDIASVLNDVLLTPDRARALTIAQQARATLADWPREHFGYRQRDVQEIVALLDEAISDLRAASGMTTFDVALVAMAPDVALEPLATLPSAHEQVTQAFRVAALTGGASERVALLQSALVMVNEAGTALDPGDAAIWRQSAQTQIRTELAVDARYRSLATRLMSQATQAAARARISDVERVLNRIPRDDARLGGQRPEMVEALRASVSGQLESARLLRLLRDQWVLRRGLYRDYQRMVGTHLLQLVRSQQALEAIRRLDGPSPDTLLALRARLRGGVDRLERMRPPSDLHETHDLIIGAWRFAESAINGRFEAASSASVPTAWEASSAAAGALLLLSRAQQEIRARLEPPVIRD